MKRLVFVLTKIPFLKRLIGMSRLIVEVLNDQNLFTESNLVNWFSSYVQFCSGGHFSERGEAARKCGKMNHIMCVNWVLARKWLKRMMLRKQENTFLSEFGFIVPAALKCLF